MQHQEMIERIRRADEDLQRAITAACTARGGIAYFNDEEEDGGSVMEAPLLLNWLVIAEWADGTSGAEAVVSISNPDQRQTVRIGLLDLAMREG